jgi:hypothetical protein
MEIQKGKGGIGMDKCQFDRGAQGCYALACYRSNWCRARDDKGNPRYAGLEDIKKDLTVHWAKDATQEQIDFYRKEK